MQDPRLWGVGWIAASTGLPCRCVASFSCGCSSAARKPPAGRIRSLSLLCLPCLGLGFRVASLILYLGVDSCQPLFCTSLAAARVQVHILELVWSERRRFAPRLLAGLRETVFGSWGGKPLPLSLHISMSDSVFEFHLLSCSASHKSVWKQPWEAGPAEP